MAHDSVCGRSCVRLRRAGRCARMDRAGLVRRHHRIAQAVPPPRRKQTAKEVVGMPQTQQKSRVIFRHPLGRFDVVEVSGRGALGAPFCLHTTVWTPERDARGLLNTPAEEVVDQVLDTPHPSCKLAALELTEAERTMILDMHEIGWPSSKIARCLRRSAGTIYSFLWRYKQKTETRKSRSGAGTPKAAVE